MHVVQKHADQLFLLESTPFAYFTCTSELQNWNRNIKMCWATAREQTRHKSRLRWCQAKDPPLYPPFRDVFASNADAGKFWGWTWLGDQSLANNPIEFAVGKEGASKCRQTGSQPEVLGGIQMCSSGLCDSTCMAVARAVWSLRGIHIHYIQCNPRWDQWRGLAGGHPDHVHHLRRNRGCSGKLCVPWGTQGQQGQQARRCAGSSPLQACLSRGGLPFSAPSVYLRRTDGPCPWLLAWSPFCSWENCLFGQRLHVP